MKVLIGLALLSVAFATPLVQPVSLPEAPQPVLEGIVLPQPELPAFEMPESVSAVQIADISPAMVPQSVIDELKAMEEVDAVRFVEVAENVVVPVEEDAVPEISADAVIFVENVEDALPVAEDSDMEVHPVRVVDSPQEAVAEDSDDIVDPVRVVETLKDLFARQGVKLELPNEETLPEIQADAVIVVDEAPEPVFYEDAPVALDEPVNVHKVIVVDHFDIPAALVEEILADAVRVVDSAPKEMYVPVAALPYPVKYYDNPLLR